MSRVFVMLTDTEAAKLHALGGASWVRLQLTRAEAPATGERCMFALTPTEKQQLLDDLPRLGRAATAKKYRVKLTTVDALRRRSQLDIDLRHSEFRPKTPRPPGHRRVTA